jgi:membrane protein
MFAGDFMAALSHREIREGILASGAASTFRVIAWTITTALLALSFALIYYWAPARKVRHWHWLTPGTVIGILGWLLASLGFRIYLHFFNQFSVTYGSLGAVVILLMWFYITGLMLLLGAEINNEIDRAAADQLRPMPHHTIISTSLAVASDESMKNDASS